MTKQDIATIVDELITLEPSLKKHRATLEKNVEAILSAKPNTKFTESFKKKLLTELRANMHRTPSPISSPMHTMQKFIYAVGGAAVASVALYVTAINPMVPMPYKDDGMMDGQVMEERMGERMAYTNPATQKMPMAQNAVSDAPVPAPTQAMNARPQSGGGGDAEMMMAEGGRAGGGGGGIPPMADSRMIAPGEPYGYTITEYVYDGEIEIPEGDLVTFKRLQLQASQKADLLSNTFVADMMDVGTLASLNVTNVSLQENGDEPLMVNVDFLDGNISINRQINYQNRPESKCRDNECWQRYRMKENDMLSDSRTISIASDFLASLGVDASMYGEPTIQDDWRLRYEMAADKSNYYFPEQITVTFPYLVNGLPVYDEWGNPNGVSVNVDQKLRAAIGVWGMRTMNLSELDMTITEDTDLIRDVVRRGGVSGGYGYPEEMETKNAELAEPRLVYVSHYEWNEDAGEGYEVYAPALAFPVRSMPQGSYEHRKAVVVPLVQEVLEQKRDVPKPYPMPMPVEPLMDPAVEPAVMEKPMMMEGEAG